MNQSALPQGDDHPNSRNSASEAGPDTVLPHHPERRSKRRALISCPLRVRSLDSVAGAVDEISTTIDVSRKGILFLTSKHTFCRGTEVAVTLPYTKSPAAEQSEQFGSVVRVSALSNGNVAVAIAFGLTALPRPDRSALPPNLVRDSSDEHKSRMPLILLVEADLAARDSLKAYLSAQGYRVLAVKDASEGREALNAVTPSLVIAEIEGEGLPGFDLCVHIKATPRLKHIPVLLTTKSAYPTDFANAHSLGAVVCMAKPYRQERLGHVVRLLIPPTPAEAKAAAGTVAGPANKDPR